jgi:hypothetical protein
MAAEEELPKLGGGETVAVDLTNVAVNNKRWHPMYFVACSIAGSGGGAAWVVS